MPPHASYILQPLNVGCFAPLKQAYKEEIRVLVNCFINYINKKAFLDAYKKVYKRVFLSNNIILSFRATSLVPDNAEVVLSKLKAKPRTPTPPALGPTT
jgi:UDP-N-acetylglucosamine pyrophosphorylase